MEQQTESLNNNLGIIDSEVEQLSIKTLNHDSEIDNIIQDLSASDGTTFRFAVNDEGEYGYILTDEEGADTVIPFKKGVADIFGNMIASQIIHM